ncbi:MAG TPA: hypothetical protein PK668_27330 [Myxococcota bacterium]|nr:hypothetical protein [Myxococcota bacterium]HRY97240.1 hypothetical protein [Myxococcota bacterium]HSA22741.1 hypothetical protein [Myxococcota bacterium]
MRVPLPLLLIAWLLAGCCPRSEAYLRAEADDALALAALPTGPDGPDGAHVAVQLRLASLHRLLQAPALLAALPPFERSLELPLPFAARGVPLAVSFRVTRLGLALAPGQPVRLALRVGYQAAVRVGGRGAGLEVLLPTGEWGLPAELALEAAVRLVAEPDGSSALALDLSRAALGLFELSLEALPAPLPGALRELLLPLARAVADATLSELRLARIPPLPLGAGGLRVSARSLRLDAARDELQLGLWTNLAVPEDGLVRPSLDRPLEADARIRLASALPELATRALLHQGGLPRRLDTDMRPDPEGARALTLTHLEFEGQELRLAFRLWSLCVPVFQADLLLRARLSQGADGRFALEAAPLELLAASDYADRIRASLAEPAEGLRSLLDSLERLLDERWLSLGPEARLGWRPLAYRLGPEAIEVDGRLEVRGAEPPHPVP